VGNTSARNARGYTSAACGIEIRSSGNFVRGNICHDNEHSGIIVQPFSGSTPVPQNRIVNNVTYANTVHGIQLKYSDNSQIVGNTVYGNGGSGIDLSGASSQCVVANNISVDNATGLNGSSYGNFRVEAASVSGTTLDYDLMYRSGTGTMVSWNGTPYASLSAFKTATSQEAHGLQAAPQWVAQASADFRLKIGSPAIDSANSAATGAADTDIVGTPRTDDRATANTGAGPRTYDDRGAYEYPLDADHDGYASDEDCDDLNPAINPGLPDDTCDGIDDNCNGQVDEGYVPVQTTCGVGACAAFGATACVNHVVVNNCTPGTPAPNDTTCDGIDDNCNGQTDEGYVPTPSVCGVGACAATGQNICVNGVVTNSCTPGTPAPADATCNGIDDNCNGQTDEGYVSTPSSTTCGIGACAATGHYVCMNGVVTDVCTSGSPAPNDTTCNGIDDDCNGQTDEGYVPTPSTCGVGACAATGQHLCVNGAVTDTCTPGTPAPSDDDCNGIDDNCNGQTDEGYAPMPTACGVGACAATGQLACINGTVTDTCTPGHPAPSDTTCNGVDDDCNGQVDDGYVPTATTCGVGACAANGQNVCVNGAVVNTCTPGTPAPSDATCDGIDDDCDGQTDEDYAPTASGTTCGVGACAATGRNLCINGTIQDVCTPGAPAVSDTTCNGIDDNCDGQIDEGYVATPTACGVGACAATGQKVCVNGAVTDTCTPGSPAPADATCDGIDDDCDGQTDEDYVPTATTTTCGIGACAATGQNLCVNGVIQDVCTPGTPAPTDATCNGIDDNCNGQVDEGYVATATACGVGACASTGQTICVNGTIVDTCTPGTPVPEIGCDGIDNDCNPATPDVMDGDGDGVTCATDCNDADASIYPGAPEINDGKDNQCPGNPGYGLVDETSGDSGFHTAGVKTEYSWPAQGGATAYEVARAGSADFNLECQTAQTAGPSWSDTQNPAAGKVFFYLNRPSTPFAGSWGARSSGAQRTVSCAAP
jgi:parallel beta-helix repeat protein